MLTRDQKKIIGIGAVATIIGVGALVMKKSATTHQEEDVSIQFTYGGYTPSEINFTQPYPALVWPRDRTKILGEYAKYGAVTFMWGNIDPGDNWQVAGNPIVTEIRMEAQIQGYQNAKTRAGILGWYVPQKGWITIDDRNVIGPRYG